MRRTDRWKVTGLVALVCFGSGALAGHFGTSPWLTVVQAAALGAAWAVGAERA